MGNFSLARWSSGKENRITVAIYAVCILLVVVMAMSGCAQLKQFDNWFNTNQASLKTAVYIATDASLRNRPQDALKVVDIVTKVKAGIAAGTLTNASTIQAFVANEMSNLNLNPADQIVMQPLLEAIEAKVVDTFKVLNLSTPSDQLVEINTILGWVLEVASVIK